MQIQISSIMNRVNLEYVINYSFLRNLCNLHRKPQVTRNFATLATSGLQVAE